MPESEHIGGYPSEQQIEDLGVDPVLLDSEGRCVAVEFPAFVLLGIYSPANSSGLRDDFRYGFICALDTRIRNLIKLGKRVVVMGDLNVSRNEMDSANAEENMRKEGVTHEEYVSTPNRRVFHQLLEGGEVVGDRDEGREQPVMWDTGREFHPTRAGMFTHWEQKINARPGNFGSRIDFVLCSLSMKSWFQEADIQEGLMGSDHCPAYAVMKDKITVDDSLVHLKDYMNPPGMFVDSKRMREHTIKDTPALSGKLLEEFDKRRSIKAMFARKPVVKQESSTSVLEPSAALPDWAISQTEDAEASVSSHWQDSPKKEEIIRDFGISGRKRQATESSPERAFKRSRSDGGNGSKKTGSAESPTAGSGKGQQSLKGFFKPKAENIKSVDKHARHSNGNGDTLEPIGDSSRDSQPSITSQEPSDVASQISSGIIENGSTASVTVNDEEERFVDPFTSRSAWSQLLTKPIAPRCECHNEPCMVMKTKKAGFNNGRQFWMCARPIGPSGSKERNTQWRCPTFIWASDWDGLKGKRTTNVTGASKEMASLIQELENG